MFTGIIQAVGNVQELARYGTDARLRIATGKLDLATVVLGDSIAVSGVCLTAVALHKDGFSADVSAETQQCTTLAVIQTGERVNLEKALTLSTPLGGHLVNGHVDGVGLVKTRINAGQSVRYVIEAPEPLARYVAAKGSVCVDGVSLTVNAVRGNVFEVNIVPYTLQETTLDNYVAGRRVNIEVDLLARYAERLLLGDRTVQGGSLTRELLVQYGFMNE